MIVSELIEQLKTMPQDALVLGRGYESGYNVLTSVSNTYVWKAIDPSSYDGDYDRAEFVWDFRKEDFHQVNINGVILV